MKKGLSFLAALVLFGVFASNAWAYSGSVTAPSGQTIYYYYNSSSQTITITYPNSYDNNWSGYSMPTGALVIPDSITHNGVKYPVTSIGSHTFDNCSGLTTPNTYW